MPGFLVGNRVASIASIAGLLAGGKLNKVRGALALLFNGQIGASRLPQPRANQHTPQWNPKFVFTNLQIHHNRASSQERLLPSPPPPCLPSALLLWVRLLYGALVAQRAAGERPGEGRLL